MDPRLLSLYEQELRYFRESTGEFAKQFPKIAGRLGIDNTEITDPYVERLIEATAFLSARVNLKLNSEYPQFTQNFLDVVYPNFLAPTPAMMVLQITPDLLDANLAAGVKIPKRSGVRAMQSTGQSTYCEFMTSQDLDLYPVQIAKVDYFRYAPDLPLAQHARARDIQGGVRITLEATAELDFSQFELPELLLHFGGTEDIAWQLQECFLGDPLGVLIRPVDLNGVPVGSVVELPPAVIEPVGIVDEESLLPQSNAGFSGYRLLHEYFAFAQKFQFVRITQLADALKHCATARVEIIVLFSRGDPGLEKLVSNTNFQLNCVPVVNLFNKRLDRVSVSDSSHEFHLVPDRTRPQDFEIYNVNDVIGYGKADKSDGSEQKFHPFYAAYHGSRHQHPAYYTTRREPRLLSARQKTQGNRTSYIGSEMFIQLVDPQEAPYSVQLKQLGVTALCSNRDLPIIMPMNRASDFEFVDGFAVQSIKAVRGPSRPALPLFGIDSSWQLIDHLSLNYLSIADASPEQAAAHIKETLQLYSKITDESRLSQINGLKAVHTKPIHRRLPMRGPIAFGRGLEITAEVDELAFHGGSVFLFGMMLSEWFKRHATTNTFVETVLRSHNRSTAERMRWRPSVGHRTIL
jgi:type VI secretion system protein ImpG